VDLDVTSLYAGASGTTDFIVRVIAEAGGGIDFNDNLEIKMMSEIWVNLAE